MLSEELSDISKFAVSIVIDNVRGKKDGDDYPEGGKVRTVTCKRQIVFGPYLSLGIMTSYLIGDRMINWYLSLI